MKKNKSIEIYCKKCGWINEPIEEKSNSNWKVVNPKCDKCGEKTSIRIITK